MPHDILRVHFPNAIVQSIFPEVAVDDEEEGFAPKVAGLPCPVTEEWFWEGDEVEDIEDEEEWEAEAWDEDEEREWDFLVDERASLEAGSPQTTRKTLHDDTKNIRKNNMIIESATAFFILTLDVIKLADWVVEARTTEAKCQISFTLFFLIWDLESFDSKTVQMSMMFSFWGICEETWHDPVNFNEENVCFADVGDSCLAFLTWLSGRCFFSSLVSSFREGSQLMQQGDQLLSHHDIRCHVWVSISFARHLPDDVLLPSRVHDSHSWRLEEVCDADQDAASETKRKRCVNFEQGFAKQDFRAP